jgi:alkylation response protein AidB-like acyl-CoA dehydrogenase
MVSGSGSGGVDRIGGSGAAHLIRLARRIGDQGRPGGWDDPAVRDEIMRLYSEERIRAWTNERIRAGLKAGRAPGPESSVGKIHQGDLNQRTQALAARLLGAHGIAWESETGDYRDSLPHEVHGMLRSLANTIEGGTTEVNKNIVAERVLGQPREPDPWLDAPWRDVPRS